MTRMATQIRVLGPVSIVADGRPLPLGYAKQRCVLAALALEAGRVVTPDRLIERVWGPHPPERARGVLYGHVARLRRAAPVMVARRSGGYVLDVAPEAVDVHRFRTLAAQARADDGPAGWQRALDLWHGPALSCVDSPWARALRVALERERLAARLRLCAAWSRLGLDEVALADLADLASDHPLHEGVAAQLMRSLCRTGHPAGALEHFDGLRRRLAEHVGADPGPELVDLQVRILRREM